MSRLAGAIALLPALVLLEYLVTDAFPFFVSIALPILLLINLATAFMLARASRRAPEIVSLRARADDAIFLVAASAAAATMGLLVIGRAFGTIPPVPREVFLIGVSYALIVLSAPAVNWLIVWRPWRREVVAPIPGDDS